MQYLGKREGLWPDRVSTWEKYTVAYNDFIANSYSINLLSGAVIHGVKVKPTVQWDGGASVAITDILTAYSLNSVVPANDEYKLSLVQNPISSISLDLTGTPTVGELDLYLNVSYPV